MDPNLITGSRAGEISTSIEDAIRVGTLGPGAALPTVRRLAERLQVSPTTVAAAYRDLQQRGLVAADGRRGTRVTSRPALTSRAAYSVPAGATDLTGGNPGLSLLPDLGSVLSGLEITQRLYGEPTHRPDLLRLAARQFEADGVSPDFLQITGGALDGIERVLQAHLRPGDRVIVEDPGYPALMDLLGTLGLLTVPVPVDDRGPRPEELERAMTGQVAAIVIAPRAQNPYGSALDEDRRKELERILRHRPELLLIEDDHAGPVAGAPALTLSGGRERWAVVRSVSKSLGPDLRLAVMAGDSTTISRTEARQRLGAGWVSHILQRAVVRLWQDPAVSSLLERASAEYERGRNEVLRALKDRGLEGHARSGVNVWIPVPDEAAAVDRLLQVGLAVAPGERFRIHAAPAIRVSVSGLGPGDAKRLAEALAAPAEATARTRSA